MFIQRKGTIDPVRLGVVSDKKNVCDIVIKLYTVSQRNYGQFPKSCSRGYDWLSTEGSDTEEASTSAK